MGELYLTTNIGTNFKRLFDDRVTIRALRGENVATWVATDIY